MIGREMSNVILNLDRAQQRYYPKGYYHELLFLYQEPENIERDFADTRYGL